MLRPVLEQNRDAFLRHKKLVEEGNCDVEACKGVYDCDNESLLLLCFFRLNLKFGKAGHCRL
jgi:hypothetical protein